MDNRDLKARHLRGSRPNSTLVGSPDVVLFVFVSLVFAMLAVPFVLTPFMRTEVSAERRELAEAPKLIVDGAYNPDFLSGVGAYLEDRFAFRAQFVEAGAAVLEDLFGTSAVDNVVVGQDEWLYYTGELADYQRTAPLSDAALDNAAMNIALMQEYVRSLGKGFCLVIAPNKSSVAGSHMPYYEVAGEGQTNLDRLEERLLARGVAFIHAAGYLDGRSYFHRDTHWTDEAALRVSIALFEALGKTYPNFYACDLITRNHVGDLETMLHPQNPGAEIQVCHTGTNSYVFANEATSVEDTYIVCTSTLEGMGGSVLVYRDSFANNLIGPFATTYGQSVFTKLVPYDMGAEQVSFAQDVVVERAERHLAFFATDPPTMPAPMRQVAVAPEPGAGTASITLAQTEAYLKVEGSVDEAARSLGPSVYCELTRTDGSVVCYECFHVSEKGEVTQDFEGQGSTDVADTVVGDGGYRCSVAGCNVADVVHVRVLVGDANLAYCVANYDA